MTCTALCGSFFPYAASDGDTSLLEVAERLGKDIFDCRGIVEKLVEAGPLSADGGRPGFSRAGA